MNELFHLNKRLILYSQNIYVFIFLENPETQKSVTSTLTLLDVRSYTFDCFFRNQNSIKKKFEQILVPIMPNISKLISFHFHSELVPGIFMILIKLQHNATF